METNINTNKEPHEFSTFDGMSSPWENGKEEIKGNKTLNLKLIIIISVITLSIILLIVLILVLVFDGCGSGYYLPEDDNSICQKCSIDNCDKCSGTKDSNICSSYLSKFIPIYEDDILKRCSPCAEGCSGCDQEKHECLSCKGGYKFRDGKCILSYSFMAKYYVDSSSKNVNLIDYDLKNKIKEVIINNEIQTQINTYYKLSSGKYTVYILLDMNTTYDRMFSLCSDMTEISFSPLFNNIEISSMNYMFAQCSSLTSIDFTNFRVKNVKSLDGMFSSCSSLKNINISKIDISKVTSMNGMFYQCKKLEKIEFPNIKTKELKNMGEMFISCESLKSLDLSNFDTKQVTSFIFHFMAAKALLH